MFSCQLTEWGTIKVLRTSRPSELIWPEWPAVEIIPEEKTIANSRPRTRIAPSLRVFVQSERKKRQKHYLRTTNPWFVAGYEAERYFQH